MVRNLVWQSDRWADFAHGAMVPIKANSTGKTHVKSNGVCVLKHVFIIFAVITSVFLSPARPIHSQQSDVVKSMEGFQNLMSEQRFAEALPVGIKTLSMLKEALGPQHPLVGDMYRALGDTYRAVGNFSSAKSSYLKALEVKIAAGGARAPDTLDMVNHLCSFYLETGQGECIQE